MGVSSKATMSPDVLIFFGALLAYRMNDTFFATKKNICLQIFFLHDLDIISQNII